MIIKVVGEKNFFLFQDIYYFFALSLDGSYCFPIKNKHDSGKGFQKSTLECIYDSWLDVLRSKLDSSGLSDKGKLLVNKLKDWMVTTNIAIITAQKGRKIRDISRDELKYAEDNKPTFLIEHKSNYEEYFVHLDGEIKEAFLCSVDFYNAFKEMNSEVIIDELTRLYNANKKDICEEVKVVSKHFLTNIKYLDTYEIVEE